MGDNPNASAHAKWRGRITRVRTCGRREGVCLDTSPHEVESTPLQKGMWERGTRHVLKVGEEGRVIPFGIDALLPKCANTSREGELHPWDLLPCTHHQRGCLPL
jgi:hypothetical protein